MSTITEQQFLTLSERDRNVLSLIQSMASLSVAEIGKSLSMRAHVVRRSIEQLRSARAIVPYVPINTAALGLSEYHVFLSGIGYYSSNMQEVIKKVVAHDFVPFASEHAGQFQFSVWARCPNNLGDLLDGILRDVPVGVSKTVILRRFYHSFAAGALTPRSTPDYALGVFGDIARIDEIDHRILRAVGTVNSLSGVDIGRAVSVPSSTVEYRVRRLQREGLILEPRYTVNQEKLGLERFYVRLKVRSPVDVRELLIQLACRMPEIASVAETIGAWDFELCIVMRTAFQTNEVLARIAGALGKDYVEMTAYPHINYLKIVNYPFKRLPV